jgi:hypothetical protein
LRKKADKRQKKREAFKKQIPKQKPLKVEKRNI